MNRGSFLKRAGVVVGALAFGKMPVSTEKSVVAAETWTNAEPIVFPTSTGLTASGGLCAPIIPYYELVLVDEKEWKSPIRDSLVSFRADRGNIEYKPARPYTFPEAWLDDQEEDE